MQSQRSRVRERWVAGAALGLGLVTSGTAATAFGLETGNVARRAHAAPVSAWDEALRARTLFEAQPKSRHTQIEFARVMDKFRTIYHDDPAEVHAGRAVEQVAQLLAEEGHELEDRKSLHDAARQYEFLAKAYPNPSGSPRALGQALELLNDAEDSTEARTVRAVLLRDYPRSSAAKAARESAVVMVVPKRGANRSESRPVEAEAAPRMVQPTVVPVKDVVVPTRPLPPPSNAVATVTAIRHWSTGSYTRVAIDLGTDEQDVAYQAVRVQGPDRIFFDLHDVKLAAELQGKSFAVTDGGLLNNIRAAQLPNGSTRVVLDVHEVGTYSAFLLPNPERLIIDIHGKQGAGNREQGVEESSIPTMVSANPAPIERVPAASSVPTMVSNNAPGARNGVEVSSLPPMPVTDGSASFGLPARTATTKATVPQPRVVIPTRPTTAKPVPNTVTKSLASNGDDVAAVSEQTGRVAATRKPTSLPVSSGIAAQTGDHYRSPRMMAAANVGATTDGTKPVKAGPVEAAAPITESSGASETTLMRALGLKIGRIVIDAGHGGHDSGTLGAGGIQEKDVVLDVALRLGKLLHDRLGAEIVYTRADDTFIPLETRTAIANKAQADLFISVHANSSQDSSARGVEVYYLNFTSDPEAMNVASRENAVSTQSVHQLSDLVKKIALKDKIDESHELAADVDQSLYGGLRKGNDGLKDRGVKKAPFVVLIGANMPSILAEISFVTNPDDAEQLQTPEYRERVAESLYKGVAKYESAINHDAQPVKGKVGVTERAAR
ncbi:N-acetylmuramoyl-L-alanine amidase [Granulicella paludicola]|uniref:N-acetylmuramoyl-L-alanine amidase n=1 Tax=Granulicella paludicola TaxID=474951 RepID=UPI0021E02D05|nr:N-acetylmuramoyl-L-alanine amidase [Granulicella paludicola]